MRIRSHKLMINKAGFTMIEVIISMAILGFLVSSVSFVYRACVKAFNAGEDRTKIRTELSQVMQLITRDVGAASAITTCASTTLTLTVGGVGVTYLFSNSNLLRNSVVKATNVQAPATSSFSCSAGQVTIDLTSLYNGETVHLRSKVNSSNMPGTNGRGLVGWWKMDESSGTSAADSSGNNYSGTLVGSASWATGQINGCVYLNNGATDQYVNLPIGALNGLNSATLSFWIKTTRSGDIPVLSGANATNDNEWLFIFKYNAPSAGNFSVRTYAGEAGVYDDTSLVGSAPNTGVWIHFAQVRDSAGTVYTYRNGVLIDTWSTTINVLSIGTNGLLLGQEQDSLAGGFATNQILDGYLDDVRIYNRVLSANEIKSIYASGT